MKAEQIWQAALGELELQMTKATFDTWLKNTSLISYEDGTFVIGVHNAYAKDWLENRLLTTIKRTLVGIVDRSVEVKFAVKAPRSEEVPHPLEALAPKSLPATRGGTHPRLNPRYTFDSFIVGPSNRLAHAASLAVVERPAEAYNPLFLYGGVGLGKTHLLQAIGHTSQKKGARVLYVSSEKFTNDLINSIRHQTTETFRRKYRNTDILLVDDIQFIAGKESTQEEFFHTFNALYEANKQIALSSDRAPKALLTLEERLRSRFEWGLIADIQPPNLETRIAILRFKAEAQPLPIPEEVINLIANRIQSNIRELEGALNRIVACAKLMDSPLIVDMADSILRDFAPAKTHLTLAEIIEVVSSYYGLEPEQLKGPRRTQEIAGPRQIAMYLAREETDASLPQIGKAFNRDHSTVLYGYEKISDQIDEDNQLRRQMLDIKEMLYKERTSPV